MKNMRKGLVAAATALTVSFAGVSVATAQSDDSTISSENTENTESSESSENTESSESTTPTVEDETPNLDEDSSLSSMSSDMEPREMRDWIAVFTAIIGALSTLFAFVNKM